MYKKLIKRFLDIVISFLWIILLVPFWLIIPIIIFIDDPGFIFFTQKRVGKNKKLFSILKFRTMKIKTLHDIPTHMLENPEIYITRVGKFLRKTSLDELPQLFNILVGHMSLVGPRPALWNQDDLISERDRYGANSIRPGLTGLAQINGRDELPISEKARLDGKYTNSISFATDIRCIVGTVSAVFCHRGVVEGKKVSSDNPESVSDPDPDISLKKSKRKAKK